VGGQPTMQNRKADLKGFEIPDIYGTQEGGKQHTKAIGQKLADARNARNMSQLDFSAASGLSVADVSTAEVGGFPIDRMNAIADTYARVLGVSAGPLKAAGPMVRMLSREDKYKRVYLGQQLKAKVKAMQTGVRDDVFGMMSFDHDYGHGQDDAHGRSAQASVCGYRNSNGNWRFISQYHIVNLTASPKTIALVSSQCVVCKNTPQKCVCPG
jgi:transcriptional regulator with XRE-family HTH domain